MRSLVLILLLTGCAGINELAGTNGMNAPWDPKPGQQLFDQIPNNNNSAESICCGHLRTCKPHQSPRC